jgi:16S rRNA processing protein RimM
MASTQSEYIGVLGRVHGLDGTFVLSDAIPLPSGLAVGTVVSIGFSRDFTKPFCVESFVQTEHRTLLKVKEISSSEAASQLLDNAVFANSSDIGALSIDRFRIGDIEGSSVIDESGNLLGTITDVWILPANDVWVMTTPLKNTIPLPVIDEVILKVDVNTKQITVRLLDGLERVDTHEDLEPDV